MGDKTYQVPTAKTDVDKSDDKSSDKQLRKPVDNLSEYRLSRPQKVESSAIKNSSNTDIYLTDLQIVDENTNTTSDLADVPLFVDRASQTISNLAQGNSAEGVVTLSTLLMTKTPTQMQELAKQYEQKTGRTLQSDIDKLANDGKISAESKQFLSSVMDSGKEPRTQEKLAELANLSLQCDSKMRLNLFDLVLGTAGDTSNLKAREIFTAQGGSEKLAKSFTNSELTQANEILKDGRVNPSTLIDRDVNNSIFYVAEENIDAYIQRMNAPERSTYMQGKYLVTKGVQPADELEQKSVEYYQRLSESMRRASEDTSMFNFMNDKNEIESAFRRWESMIETGDANNLIARISRHRDDLDGVNKELMNMSESEWKALRDPSSGFRTQVEETINGSFSSTRINNPYAHELNALNVLENIVRKKNFEDVAKHSPDRLTHLLGMNRNYPEYFGDILSKADSTTREKLVKDSDYYNTVRSQIVFNSTEGSPQQRLALYQLELYRSNKEPDALDRLNIQVMKMAMEGSSSNQRLAEIGGAIQKNRSLAQMLSTDPRGEYLVATVKNALPGNEDASNRVLRGDKLTSQQLQSLITTETTRYNPKTEMPIGERTYSTSADELAVLAPVSETTNVSLTDLTAAKRTVADNIAKQGATRSEDTLRLNIIDSKVNASETISELEKLSLDQRKALASEYTTKYGGDLAQDLMSRVSDETEKEKIRQLWLDNSKTSEGIVSKNLGLVEASNNVSQTGRTFTNLIEGGDLFANSSKQAIETSKIVADLRKSTKNATPEQKQELDKAIASLDKAIIDLNEGKKDAVNQVKKAALAVGLAVGVATAPFNGGIALAGISACIAVSVAEKITTRLIEGGQYTQEKAIADGVALGFDVALNLSPLVVSRLLKPGVANSLLKSGINETEFCDELRNAIKLTAKDQIEGEKAMKALAEKYAANGKSEQLMSSISNEFKGQTNKIAEQVESTTLKSKQSTVPANPKIATEKEALERITDLKTTPMRSVWTADDVTNPVNQLEDETFIKALRKKYTEPFADRSVLSNYSQRLANSRTTEFSLTRRFDDKLVDGANLYGYVVNRNEPGIQDLMNFAKLKYGHLPPELRGEAYTRFAKKAFQDDELIDGVEYQVINGVKQNRIRENFLKLNPTRSLNDSAMLKSGVCLEEAIFFKMLADQHSDWKVSLVVGNSVGDDTSIFKLAEGEQMNFNHAWNEIKINNQTKVYDPRQRIYGQTYDEILIANGSTHTPADEILVAGMPDAVTLKNDPSSLYKFKGYDVNNGNAIIYKPNNQDIPTATTFQSLEELTAAGWTNCVDNIYVKNGVPGFTAHLPNGNVIVYETSTLRSVPPTEVTVQRGISP